jgi:ketosteroid isomerase-like protein
MDPKERVIRELYKARARRDWDAVRLLFADEIGWHEPGEVDHSGDYRGAHWGHGYTTEAAATIREWAHECRSIDQLVSLISSDNVRSQRVAERLGAIPTETVTPVDSGRKTVVWKHPPAA